MMGYDFAPKSLKEKIISPICLQLKKIVVPLHLADEALIGTFHRQRKIKTEQKQ